MKKPRERQSPGASVIVPVWNGAETLGSCLEALAAQDAGKNCTEVIVVDDGSSDESAAVARTFDVQLIQQPHGGAAAARNRGAQAANAEILLFTDADCRPLADWVERMLAPFSNPEVVGVKGVYRTQQRSLVARFCQAEYLEKYQRLARRRYIDFVDTYSAAYRRGTFLEHGGFDPEFLFDEDQEFSYRLAGHGLKMVLAPDAAVYHQHPHTLGGYLKRKLVLGQWKVRVHRRHPERALSDSYTPWSQRAQMVLVWPVLVALILSAGGILPWWTAAGLAALLLLTTLPLVAQAWSLGWDVAAAAPLLAIMRAFALTSGLVMGMVTQPDSK
jgi:cellulose synthase/poly-beta-1,6-N-acetylglucosamine synthase-like glycosyltransferase